MKQALTPGTTAFVVLILFCRLQVSRSPLQSLLSEGLDGAATIRAFRQQPAFLERLRIALDANTAALLCWTAAQRWCDGFCAVSPEDPSTSKAVPCPHSEACLKGCVFTNVECNCLIVNVTTKK